MDLPPEARRRIEDDRIVWLTTITDRGAPAPNPVWFVADGDDLVVFTTPGSVRVHNIEQRSTVSLHFNSDADGGDIVVITGEAETLYDQTPSKFPGYLAKYERAITGQLNMTIDEIDGTYNTRLRIRPTRVRLTSG